jgi:lactate dehydrogenase-like 2-hydroxyacid dehydrogenase
MKLYIFSPNKKAIFSDALLAQLSKNYEVVFYETPTPLSEHTDFVNDETEKVVALDPDYFGWRFTKEDVDLCKNVKAFCLQTTSFSWIDTDYAKEKNVPVLNLKGFSSEAVAEFAFMLALGVARKLPLIIQADYKQDFVEHQGIELRGKVAGVIGLGNIGTDIAEKCKGFGMKTLYWSKNTKNEKFEYSELSNLLEVCDVIFVALAQNSNTQNILTDELLRKMKKTGIFVSIAHKVFNEDTIIKMVQDGELYGYGTEEDNGSPKIKGNILVLPAVAWATNESMSLNGEMWVNSILELKKDIFVNKVS